ncbi:Protein MOR1 [Camellia lanceoleosa]|uniref:Protein MOR1 n=1 Tax=Camellia lanceoleosa TaxID=1840588 RepID=A0ACC0GS15_9ERIC|nr:Protein MOR1 [Camellia lanceoleosa]
MKWEVYGTQIGMLSVSLAKPDGTVFGGAVAGSLIAAGPVQFQADSKYPKDQQIGTRPSLLQNISYASAKKLGFNMLISRSPRSGQRYLASCLLHCFVGNVEIQKVDLATISQEGHGDDYSRSNSNIKGSSSFARPDVDMHSRSRMATLSTIGAVASAMGLAVEKSSKVPDITTALMDAKLGTEGRKDLFDWLSRQLSGLSFSVVSTKQKARLQGGSRHCFVRGQAQT